MADGSTNDNEIEAVTQEDESGNDKESNAMGKMTQMVSAAVRP